jgi:hypothetical protein
VAAELVCPEEPSTDGAYRLSWAGDAGAWELVEDGARVYEGADTATTLTGRREGAHVYELKEWGKAETLARCEVSVEPYSLGQAFSLLGVGAFVFVATVVFVVRGHRAHRAGTIG